MPRVGRPLDYAPVPVDMDMVREGLLLHGTICEYNEYCNTQALTVHLGHRAVVYLCVPHKTMVDGSERQRVDLEKRIKALFNEMYNVYVINARMGGGFADEMDRIQADAKAQARTDATELRAAKREVIKEMNKNTKVGAPDSALAQARGAKSPSRGQLNQRIIRNPDLYARPADLSSKATYTDLDIIPVELLP